MSGRYEQLGRQLRKVRTSFAKVDDKATSLALRRATHLAADLVLEHVETDDVAPGLAELVTREIVDAALAERLGRVFSADEPPEHVPAPAEVTERGRDLDRLLRSLEHGARMPELPFAALVATDTPPSESRAALTISGRIVVIAGRGGEGLVFVDDRPVGRPFAMPTPPKSRPDVAREPTGTTRITWESEGLAVELGPDFTSATRVL